MSNAPAPNVLKFDSNQDRLTDAAVKACLTLVGAMTPAQRELFLRQLTEKMRPIPVPKAGDVLSVVVQLMPRDREWSVKEMKDKVFKSSSEISEKEIYNAVGYLTRKNHITRVGQGRYIINGIAVLSADDFGGQPNPTEGDHGDY